MFIIIADEIIYLIINGQYFPVLYKREFPSISIVYVMKDEKVIFSLFSLFDLLFLSFVSVISNL